MKTHFLRLISIAAWIFGSFAFAQPYPSKPVRVIVPQAAGGAPDVLARIISEKLRPKLGQSFVVENRPGAGGIIGVESVAKAAPDGYTILFGGSASHGINSAVYRNLPYDPVKDFAPVALLVRPYWGLFVTPSLPVRTAADLVSAARKQPGKLNYASYGVGSANHLMSELFNSMAGIDIVHVPYKGAPAAEMGVISGDSQYLFDGVGNASAHVKTGKLRMIGVASGTRTPLSPDTPTISESGVPGYGASGISMSVFAPAGTPKSIVAILSREWVNTLSLPDVHDWLVSQAYEIVGGSPEELSEEVKREISKWQTLVRERNLKFD
jgi:tripartite-type tricarboxylate transporter receptor subunit TctC